MASNAWLVDESVATFSSVITWPTPLFGVKTWMKLIHQHRHEAFDNSLWPVVRKSVWSASGSVLSMTHSSDCAMLSVSLSKQ